MILLTPELHATLRVNAERSAEVDHDPAPVVKFFNPLGAATWLATELYDDGDTLFGLADLGFGCPEPGCFSLSELASIRLSFGARHRARYRLFDDRQPVGLGRYRAPGRFDQPSPSHHLAHRVRAGPRASDRS